MRVFTKLDGKLSCWEVEDLEYAEAVELVRSVIQAESGVEHKNTVLVLVKY
jgi:hypothetical protein